MYKTKTDSMNEIEPLNKIQQMQKLVKGKFPRAKVILDEPLHKSGAWALDVSLDNYHLAIAWQAKKGFGLVADKSHGYGEGFAEVHDDLEGAFSRVVQLLQWKRSTVPPQAVSLKEVREELGLSQEEVGMRLGKKQGAISRQEARSDCHISTLTEYVKAMGCELVLKVVLPNGTEKELRFDQEPNLVTGSKANRK